MFTMVGLNPGRIGSSGMSSSKKLWGGHPKERSDLIYIYFKIM
jgi:hypothetical protein